MRFLTRQQVRERFDGRTVAIVGGGPSATINEPGLIDSHDIVVRVNNYRLAPGTGKRTDVFYSFFGASIKKTPKELTAAGVKLCLCKCPDAQPVKSEWHRIHRKPYGIDFRYIYQRRRGWWFCDTYIPSTDEFLQWFDLLGRHVPTSGFAAILDVTTFNPKSIYLTGFDFFSSGVHNLNEPWRHKNISDPIGHRPQLERAWLAANLSKYPIAMDRVMSESFGDKV
jgi:hypothetical protein